MTDTDAGVDEGEGVTQAEVAGGITSTCPVCATWWRRPSPRSRPSGKTICARTRSTGYRYRSSCRYAAIVCDVTSLEIPATGSAEVHVLHDGYVGLGDDGERVSGTVTLIRDGNAVIIVDPGMVADRDALLAALEAHGPAPQDVTDVVFSHRRPDHTVNAALFRNARIHDHWAVYQGDRWLDRDAHGAQLGPSVRFCGHRGTPRGHLHGRVRPQRGLRLHPRLVVGGRTGDRSARRARRPWRPAESCCLSSRT